MDSVTTKHWNDRPAEDAEALRVHYKIVDPAYMGSGRDGDPWVMTSWDVEPCSCATPWRHAHGTV